MVVASAAAVVTVPIALIAFLGQPQLAWLATRRSRAICARTSPHSRSELGCCASDCGRDRVRRRHRCDPVAPVAGVQSYECQTRTVDVGFVRALRNAASPPPVRLSVLVRRCEPWIGARGAVDRWGSAAGGRQLSGHHDPRNCGRRRGRAAAQPVCAGVRRDDDGGRAVRNGRIDAVRPARIRRRARRQGVPLPGNAALAGQPRGVDARRSRRARVAPGAPTDRVSDRDRRRRTRHLRGRAAPHRRAPRGARDGIGGHDRALVAGGAALGSGGRGHRGGGASPGGHHRDSSRVARSTWSRSPTSRPGTPRRGTKPLFTRSRRVAPPRSAATYNAAGGIDRWVSNSYAFRSLSLAKDLLGINGYDPLLQKDWAETAGGWRSTDTRPAPTCGNRDGNPTCCGSARWC